MAMTIGIVVVAGLAAKAAGVPRGYDDVDLAMDQLCGEAWETLVIALCPPILDQNVLPFDVSVVPKA